MKCCHPQRPISVSAYMHTLVNTGVLYTCIFLGCVRSAFDTLAVELYNFTLIYWYMLSSVRIHMVGLFHSFEFFNTVNKLFFDAISFKCLVQNFYPLYGFLTIKKIKYFFFRLERRIAGFSTGASYTCIITFWFSCVSL